MKKSTRKVLDAFLAKPDRTLTTHELVQPEVGGTRYGARIGELRNEHGCGIDSRRETEGGWSYTLTEWPSELAGTASPPGGVGGAGELGGNGEPLEVGPARRSGAGADLGEQAPFTRRNRYIWLQVVGRDGVWRWERWERREWDALPTQMVDEALAELEAVPA